MKKVVMRGEYTSENKLSQEDAETLLDSVCHWSHTLVRMYSRILKDRSMHTSDALQCDEWRITRGRERREINE